MPPVLLVATVACVFGISAGQLLFKQAATSISDPLDWHEWLFNGWLFAALVIYGITTLGWMLVLRQAPLRLAYPFMGLAFVIVPFLSWLFLAEPLHWQSLLGGAMIIAGIVVTTRA